MENKTSIGLSANEKTFLLMTPTLAGALLGWFLPALSGWLVQLPFIPFNGILKWISTFENNWVPVIAAGLGALAGIIFALYILDESLSITVSNREVTMRFKGETAVFCKPDISAVFLTGKGIVLLGCDGIELYRGQTDSSRELVARSFRLHGYPWNEKDPFIDQYQRWVPDHPGYPQHINALLSARERALQKGEKDEVSALRSDLVKLGVIVRDEGKRQYVRMIKIGGEINERR